MSVGGTVTAAVCSLSGASGPVLVVPVLAVDLRVAVGAACYMLLKLFWSYL